MMDCFGHWIENFLPQSDHELWTGIQGCPYHDLCAWKWSTK